MELYGTGKRVNMPSRAGWVTDLLSLPEDLSPPEEGAGVTVVLVDRFGVGLS
jgi:hypothetical protein